MFLAYGIALSLFIIIECIRFEFKNYKYGLVLHKLLKKFTDARDAGPLITSHFYLLLGCALPLWQSIIQESNDKLCFILGVLILGIGDMMASFIGVLYGKHRWNGLNKTIEGTIAAFLSTFIVAIFISKFILKQENVNFYKKINTHIGYDTINFINNWS